jgi:serine/threonine protein kinase
MNYELLIEMYLKTNLYFFTASKISIKVDGVRSFNYEEMTLVTNNFSQSAQVGQGGYGKVYKGNLPDGTVVAIKRAQEGSLQGEKEFLTEIQLLSRLHHRNLVSLIGYCDEDGEQVTLVLKAHKCELVKFFVLVKFKLFFILDFCCTLDFNKFDLLVSCCLHEDMSLKRGRKCT